MTIIRKIFGDNKGATAIEYGLIAALVAVAAIVAMRNLGGSIKNTFATAGANLDGASSAAASGGASAGTK